MQIGKNQLKRCKYGWMLFHGPYIGKCFELYGQYSEAEVNVLRHRHRCRRQYWRPDAADGAACR
jgi:hypothetical protein